MLTVVLAAQLGDGGAPGAAFAETFRWALALAALALVPAVLYSRRGA